MIKKEMIKLLTDEYGYKEEDLKDDRGNTLTNKALEDIIKKEEESSTEVVNESYDKQSDGRDSEDGDIFEVDETVFASRHNLKDDDLILCMSGVSGSLNFISPLSGFRASTSGFGQTLKIPYRDLVYVRNIAVDAFEKGQIIVLNKAIQEEFGLTDLYKAVITPKNIREVINMEAGDLSQFISDMPESMKSALYDEARKMYDAGALDSVSTIKVLEEEFGISFEDNSPIEDKV